MNPLEAARPKTLEEYGASLHVSTTVTWLKSVQERRAVKPILLLYGPPGCGKTTLVRCLAKSLNLEMTDTNASEDRSMSAIRAAANAAMNGTVVFLDEADQIGTKEQKLLAKLSPEFEAPVFMAANDHSKIERELMDVCLAIEIPTPSKQKLREVGKKVGASPKAVAAASSFRDLVHDSNEGTKGDGSEGDVISALLGGDSEAGKTSDLMRVGPWILDNTDETKTALEYDLWESRYRQAGSSMEKYLRRAAASAKLTNVRFPWSLALRGRARREREVRELAKKQQEKEERAQEKKEDMEGLKKAQEMAAKPKVEDMESWL